MLVLFPPILFLLVVFALPMPFPFTVVFILLLRVLVFSFGSLIVFVAVLLVLVLVFVFFTILLGGNIRLGGSLDLWWWKVSINEYQASIASLHRSLYIFRGRCLGLFVCMMAHTSTTPWNTLVQCQWAEPIGLLHIFLLTHFQKTRGLQQLPTASNFLRALRAAQHLLSDDIVLVDTEVPVAEADAEAEHVRLRSVMVVARDESHQCADAGKSVLNGFPFELFVVEDHHHSCALGMRELPPVFQSQRPDEMSDVRDVSEISWPDVQKPVVVTRANICSNDQPFAPLALETCRLRLGRNATKIRPGHFDGKFGSVGFFHETHAASDAFDFGDGSPCTLVQHVDFRGDRVALEQHFLGFAIVLEQLVEDPFIKDHIVPVEFH
mmetsp:Transcript_11321/g.24501  ORF Transcript_11321/g.24501 Transcript_11321/m.24501 type:complete len:380 (+) Transcript_11321:72-1211(+)